MQGYRHILLTTDFTDTGKKCVQKASAMAQQYGAKLTIVHVVEPLPAYAMSYMGSVNLEEEMLTQAQLSLEQQVKEFSLTDVEQRVELGSIKACILKIAKDENADLIIVGSHGRHGLERLIGSTASAVLQGAECDVLVVHTYD
jgi:universal stress protein A